MTKEELLQKLQELYGNDSKIELRYHIDNNGLVSFQGTVNVNK